MQKNKYDNNLIVLEGIDGSGKSRTCSELTRFMNSGLQRRISLTMNDREFLGRKLLGKLDDQDLEQLLSELCYGGTILFSDLPIKNPYSKIKKQIERMPSMDLQFFHFLTSALFKNEIIEALLPYVNIVIDRYIYSVLAHHQAHGANLDTFNLSEFPIIEPDIHVLLTCQESERRRRLINRGDLNEKDKREKTPGSELEKIEDVFKSHKPHIIDTTDLSVEAVRSNILTWILIGNATSMNEISQKGYGSGVSFLVSY